MGLEEGRRGVQKEGKVKEDTYFVFSHTPEFSYKEFDIKDCIMKPL